jgi:hypothetical protein
MASAKTFHIRVHSATRILSREVREENEGGIFLRNLRVLRATFRSDFLRGRAQFGSSSGFSLSGNKLKFELQQL